MATNKIIDTILGAILLLNIIACESDYSSVGDANSIAFSADTLSFDTVFSGNASITAKLMLYNRSSADLTLDNIKLVGGTESDYNVSINGTTGTQLSSVRLRSGDSLHIFVNVFPPINTNEPYCITEDDIVVSSGSNQWRAHLWTCALTANNISGEITTNEQWQKGIPYLITDTLTIRPEAQLTIAEGTQIYLATNALISVEGALIVSGTYTAPVTISTMHLSDFYSDIPGQWQGIELHGDNASANISYTQIANATTALQADSATTLRLTDVEIRDARQYAISSDKANIELNNCILSNCSASLLQINGGTATITHCTLANYYRWNIRTAAAVEISATDLYSFRMLNSVVVGNQANEVKLAEEIDTVQCLISHCYLRLDPQTAADTDKRYEAVIVGQDPKFKNRTNNDYRPKEESPLINAADAQYSTHLPTDHNGNNRLTDSAPDIGAFEWIADEKQPN